MNTEKEAEKEKKAEIKFQKETLKVLGIYEEKGPIWGMGAAGALLIIAALVLSFSAGLSGFSDPKFVVSVLCIVAGAGLAVAAGLLYNAEKYRAAHMRETIVGKAVNDNDLLGTLVRQFVIGRPERRLT